MRRRTVAIIAAAAIALTGCAVPRGPASSPSAAPQPLQVAPASLSYEAPPEPPTITQVPLGVSDGVIAALAGEDVPSDAGSAAVPPVEHSDQMMSQDEAEEIQPQSDAPAAGEPDPAPAVVDDVTTAEPSHEVTVPGAGDTVDLDTIDGAERAAGPAIVGVPTFQTIAATWPVGTDNPSGLQVRVRSSVDGTWSEWFELQSDGSAPDSGTVDAIQQTRAGTTTLYVGDADAVQVATVEAVDAALETAGVDLALIGSPEPEPASVPEAASQVTNAVFEPSGAQAVNAIFSTGGVVTAGVAAAAGPPAMVTRAQWGAAAPTCAMESAGKLLAGVVHHTAGSSSYASQAAAMQQIRNDQAYHMKTRGWCDLGYNFVVDKWGTLYEGRAGSMDRNVIGVHAGGFNTGTVGVSVLGTYSTSPFPAATVDTVGKILGWKLGQAGVDPQGTVSFATGGGENSKYPAGSVVTLPRIFGHRDVAYTDCPGGAAYAQLGSIRAVAATNLGSARGLADGAQYRAHSANVGWLGWQAQGTMAGTTGRALPMEAFSVHVAGLPAGSGVDCRAHSANVGWLPWAPPDATCGTTGQANPLEAFKLVLTGPAASTHRIWYRAHVAQIGWQPWTSNSGVAGTTGRALEIEAIQVVVTPASAPPPEIPTVLKYAAHAADIGWMAPVAEGATAGTTGQSRRVESVSVTMAGAAGGIECSAHNARVGWQSWVGSGGWCGVTGHGLQLEAIKVRPIGAVAANIDVWYRVHSANVGWSGWARNGEPAGTQGLGYQAEAIQLMYLAKGAPPPGATANALRIG